RRADQPAPRPAARQSPPLLCARRAGSEHVGRGHRQARRGAGKLGRKLPERDLRRGAARLDDARQPHLQRGPGATGIRKARRALAGEDEMSTDLAAIESTIQTYFDGLYEGDTRKLAAAFHECCHLYWLDADTGGVKDLPRDEWLKLVDDRPK